MQPCACKGSQQYVHRSCLQTWQQMMQTSPNSRRAIICNVCTTPFSIRPPPLEPVLPGLGAQVWRQGAVMPLWLQRILVVLAVCMAGVLHNLRYLPSLLHLLAVIAAIAYAAFLHTNGELSQNDRQGGACVWLTPLGGGSGDCRWRSGAWNRSRSLPCCGSHSSWLSLP